MSLKLSNLVVFFTYKSTTGSKHLKNLIKQTIGVLKLEGCTELEVSKTIEKLMMLLVWRLLKRKNLEKSILKLFGIELRA